MSFLSALRDNPFLQSAFIGGVLASIASGVVGTYVVVKEISSISGSIAHSILGGIGFALFLKYAMALAWVSPLYGALAIALISALIIGVVHLKYMQKEDAIIASIWTGGISLGIIFISYVPGATSEFTNYLIGNILFIDAKDLWVLAALDLIILCLVFLCRKQFLAICFDEEGAKLQGINVHFFYFLLLALVAISATLLIDVIGTILVIALLTIPATLASLFAKRIQDIMLLAVLFSLIFVIVGLFLAYTLAWSPGATISLVAVFSYLTGMLVLKKSLRLVR
jgi:zinc transport system permease protein